jgi:hypothetical protein
MNTVPKQRDIFKSALKPNSHLCLDQHSILCKPNCFLTAIFHDAASCSDYTASVNMDEYEVLMQ